LDDDDGHVVTAASATFGSDTVFGAQQHTASPAQSHKASPLSPLSPLVAQPRVSPPHQPQPNHQSVTMAAQTFAHSALFTASKPQRTMAAVADADVVKYAAIPLVLLGILIA
jgi:hypothetical protein